MSPSFPDSTLRWAEKTSSKVFELIDNKGNEKIPNEPHISFFPFIDILNNVKRKIFPYKRMSAELSSAEKKAVAAGIFYGLTYKYGFEEALETDNWVPWPDKCNMVNCYSQAAANYVVSKSSGLNPVLVEFVGLQKAGDTMRAGHSLVIADVGEKGKPEFWAIDQSMRMYGPVLIDNNTMKIENLAAIQERTHRRDYRKEIYGFIISIANSEENIIKHIEELRSKPEAILYTGQRIGCPTIDAWQSKEPINAQWYLKFIPDRTRETGGDIVSRILISRPGIKSRGLEYKITLNNGEIQDERFFGFYCKGNVWSDFVSPIPLVNIPFEDLKVLVKGLTDIPLENRPEFELSLMKEASNPSEKQQYRINAARESFTRAIESDYGNIILAMAATEALYQHDKGEKVSYLNSSERAAAIKKLRDESPLIEYYVRTTKIRDRTEKARKLLEKRPELLDKIVLLKPNQIEDRRTQIFLELRNEQERLEYIIEHKPNYFDDAIDRLIFYDRRIKGREGIVLDIAKETFGSNYDSALFGGYVRIFAEFLGHAAVTFSELSLEEYKRKIIKKLTSNN